MDSAVIVARSCDHARVSPPSLVNSLVPGGLHDGGRVLSQEAADEVGGHEVLLVKVREAHLGADGGDGVPVGPLRLALQGCSCLWLTWTCTHDCVFDCVCRNVVCRFILHPYESRRRRNNPLLPNSRGGQTRPETSGSSRAFRRGKPWLSKWQCPETVRKSSGRRTVCGRFPDIEVRKSSAWRTGSGRLPDLEGPGRSPGREIRDSKLGHAQPNNSILGRW